MERLRIEVRKTLWLTLSAIQGKESTALAFLLSKLARDRQNAHILKTLGHKSGPVSGEEIRRKDGAVICTVSLEWTRSPTNEKCMEVCDWLAPLVFQAQRAGGSFAALCEVLTEAGQ